MRIHLSRHLNPAMVLIVDCRVMASALFYSIAGKHLAVTSTVDRKTVSLREQKLKGVLESLFPAYEDVLFERENRASFCRLKL